MSLKRFAMVVNLLRMTLLAAGVLLASAGALSAQEVLKIEPKRTLPPPLGAKNCGNLVHLAFSPDGKRLGAVALRGRDGNSVHVWALASGEELFNTLPSRSVRLGLGFTADGKKIIHGDHDGIVFRDAEDGTIESKIKVAFRLEDDEIAYSPKGEIVATASRTGDREDGRRKARVYDTKTKQEKYTIPDGVPGMSFSPDGQFLALPVAQGGRPKIHVYDAATGKLRVRLDVEGWRPLFTPNLKYLIVPTLGSLEVWDLASGKRAALVPTPKVPVSRALAFLREGRVLVVTAGQYGLDRVDMASMKLMRRLEMKLTGSGTSAIAVSQDGKLLALTLAPEPGNNEPRVAIFEVDKLLK